MAWPAAASGRTEMTQRLGAQRVLGIAPMAGRQDRRFPCAGMKNCFYINGD
jgi:hypothetical protein